MLVLIFDTETTGLPLTRTLNKDLLDKWPYIVQLSYILYDTEKCKKIGEKDWIIQLPPEIEINAETTEIHGITTDISRNQGISIQIALDEFIRDWKFADLIVAHNMTFDLNMLQVELLRLSNNNIVTYNPFYDNLQKANNLYCTMQESIELCNIIKTYKNGHTYVKFPKLSELHEKLFLTTPSNLHNALNDVIVCLRCFYKLKFDKDILELDEDMKEVASTLNMV